DARDAGRYSRGWMTGLNTRPFNLPAQIRRVMKLPADASVQVIEERVEAVTTAVFWFAATYTSERREQELFQVAIDLRTGREVRHIELLLDAERLTDQPIE